ncbi:MAG: c-type cytochrome [Gammaproteobacteria bacterium]
MKLKHLVAGCCALAVTAAAGIATAADAPKSEDLIKARQAAYAFVGWNMGRIKASVAPGATFNREEVVKAANAIKGVANSGLGALFVAGTEKGNGFHHTHIKPEALLPKNAEKLGQLAGDFNREANALADVAASGDQAAVAAQFGKLGGTCKACHDDFRQKIK